VERNLKGIKVINIGYNLPAPLAASKLANWGAHVLKIEPPGGDPLKEFCPAWYLAMVEKQEIINLDLKTKNGLRQLYDHLTKCDIFLTSSRLSSIDRMGIGWDFLHSTYPNLCMISIVGFLPPNDDIPGHDLTYMAMANLLNPPEMPRSLYADILGAERVVQAVFSLLLHRQVYGIANLELVPLGDSLDDFKAPLEFGLTRPGGILGGGEPRYNIFRSKDGWLALAALENKFWSKIKKEFHLSGGNITKDKLQNIFSQKTTAEWISWANDKDIPLVEIP